MKLRGKVLIHSYHKVPLYRGLQKILNQQGKGNSTNHKPKRKKETQPPMKKGKQPPTLSLNEQAGYGHPQYGYNTPPWMS